MTLALDVWQLVSALAGLLGFFGMVLVGFGKVLLGQFERRLDERFGGLEAARVDAQKHWDAKFLTLEKSAADEAREWQRIEREIMGMKADLPIHYVRRDDYIRNQTIIEAKLDGLAMKIENALLKGERHG